MKFEPCLIAKVAMVAVVTCAFASAGRSLLNVANLSAILGLHRAGMFLQVLTFAD